MSWWSTLAAFGKHRALTAEEYAWATGVFGDTLPPRERIRLSPAIGLKRRPFTFPTGPRRRTTMFLGERQADPVGTDPALFAHELTHVWQIAHARPLLGWLVQAVVTQIRFSLGRNVYDVGTATAPWRRYGLEQQATIVEHWVADRGGPEAARLAHYLDDHVRAARRIK